MGVRDPGSPQKTAKPQAEASACGFAARLAIRMGRVRQQSPPGITRTHLEQVPGFDFEIAVDKGRREVFGKYVQR